MYNAGIMLWYLRRFPRPRWDSIWWPVYKALMKKWDYLLAAEQVCVYLKPFYYLCIENTLIYVTHGGSPPEGIEKKVI